MKRRKTTRPYRHLSKAIQWLPIDSRLFPFLGLSHVKGLARIFLIIEMTMSVTVVAGSLVLVILHIIL